MKMEIRHPNKNYLAIKATAFRKNKIQPIFNLEWKAQASQKNGLNFNLKLKKILLCVLFDKPYAQVLLVIK